MAAASVPGECPICAEEFRRLRILPCDHKFCLSCLQRVSRGGTVECPICRRSHHLPNLNQLPSIYFGLLNCNICQEDHPSSRCYWCPTCFQIICSVCCLDIHSSKGHEILKWDTQQAVKDCFSHSQKLVESPGADVEPSPDGIKKIKEFCSEVEDLLIAKFRRDSVPVDNRIPFHECLQELFGELDISGTNDLSGTGNVNHLEGVSQQILKLATDGNTERFSNHSLSAGIGNRKTVDAFTRSPSHFADSIWESIRLKQEKISETATSPVPPVPPATTASPVPPVPPATSAGKLLNLCKKRHLGNEPRSFLPG